MTSSNDLKALRYGYPDLANLCQCSISHSPPATLVSWIFLQYSGCIPTPDPLHFSFCLEYSFLRYPQSSFLSSIRSLIKHYIFSHIFPGSLCKIAPPHVLYPISLLHFHSYSYRHLIYCVYCLI